MFGGKGAILKLGRLHLRSKSIGILLMEQNTAIAKQPYYTLDYKDKQRLCSKRTLELKSNLTEAEKRVKELFIALGVKHKTQKGFIKGDFFCIADFYLPFPYCAVVEVDGGYHNNAGQVYRDVKKDEYYKSRRFRVLRITNDVAMSMTESDLKKQLDALLLQVRKSKRSTR
jgi:very-short-patch-repair endonuclease